MAIQTEWRRPVSYVFQSMLIDTMRQYAMVAAEEYLSKGGVEDEETQRESLQVETDAELAEDAVSAWNLEDMDFNALTKAFADLRMRLTT
jgi:hypothetical protein